MEGVRGHGRMLYYRDDMTSVLNCALACSVCVRARSYRTSEMPATRMCADGFLVIYHPCSRLPLRGSRIPHLPANGRSAHALGFDHSLFFGDYACLPVFLLSL